MTEETPASIIGVSSWLSLGEGNGARTTEMGPEAAIEVAPLMAAISSSMSKTGRSDSDAKSVIPSQ